MAILLASPFLTIDLKHAYAASLNYSDALVAMVNLGMMRAQLSLVEKSHQAGDNEMAFEHAFIPHTTIFPSIKNLLLSADKDSADQLEAALADLPVQIRTGHDSKEVIEQKVSKIQGLIDEVITKSIGPSLAPDTGMINQTVAFLLKDADHSYQLSGAGQLDKQLGKVDYENTQGLIEIAKSDYYQKIADKIDQSRAAEINSFFPELQKAIETKSDYQAVSRWISGIERSLSAALSASGTNTGSAGSLSNYLSNVRVALTDVIRQVKNGNYAKADESATVAYLDNYEYLEAPLQKYDQPLEKSLEVGMREELRQMIKSKEPSQAIEAFVNAMFPKLDRVQELLKNEPSFNKSSNNSGNLTIINGNMVNIEELSKGFGTYAGEKKSIGQADDSAKSAVRSSIDQIKLKLDESLNHYKQGDREGAMLSSRSAYLDSYETVEKPLRPINPDFTLDMEIKFAELRNLIQSQAPYEKVESKIVEIRKGLDESERLVSGTGIIAPTLAFSSSFSLIFREGLESALILGAILTYLEASRNDRFKKHVYYGVLLSIGATAATWFIAQFVIEISGASKSLIEAIAGISAVAVLFWVSFWILNKVETKKWIEFVKARVWKATTTGSVMVFVMLSFFTVYREGFETVLFYQAMLSFAKYMELYVTAGLFLGLAIIVTVVLVIRKLGKKLPLRVLFGVTMGVGAYMSIAFIGNAVREFQELDYISTTPMIGVVPRLDINIATMTGIHPTMETVVAQIILLSVYIIGSMYILILQPRRRKLVEASRKSRADLLNHGSGHDDDKDVSPATTS
jgi:high-affinity iron transporter